jgi:hypothetical protein
MAPRLSSPKLTGCSEITVASQVYRPHLLAAAVAAAGLHPAAGLLLKATAMLPLPNDDAFMPKKPLDSRDAHS